MTHSELTDWKSRLVPAFDRLSGQWIDIVPTDADRDARGLYTATKSGDPALWTFLPYGPFDDQAALESWLLGHVTDPTLLPVTIAENESGEVLGNVSFMSIVTDHGVIEIGHIIFGPSLQRTAAATEAIFLMLRHVFDDLGYRRVEWKCDAANERSVGAALRFGFKPEGVFRQHRIVKGRNRDTAWFSIIDGDWPRVRSGFEAWLSPTNFDNDGRQRQKLEDVRKPIGEIP